MNWGHKIAIFFTCFVIFMLYMVYRSFNVEFHLVAEDYYDREIRFQEQINKTNNANALPEKVQISYKGKKVNIKFPSNQAALAKGQITFFRPSDARLDTRFEIRPGSDGLQTISAEQLPDGYYQLQLDWEADGKAFYKEEKIFLQ